MGILNVSENININIGDVEAAQGYFGEVGACRIALESAQNEMLLFNSFLQSDIVEYTRVHEGASDEELMAIRENAFTDALEKIKQFLMKVWEKIKGLFESAIAKFNSIFMKDNKEFYNKYIGTINHSTKSFENFKAKYSKPTGSLKDVRENIDKLEVLIKEQRLNYEENYDYKDLLENWDSDEVYEYMLKELELDGCTSKSSFKKDFHNFCFESEDTPNWDKSKITEAIRVLSEKSAINGLKQAKTKSENAIKKMITVIEKSKRELAKVKTTTDKTTNTTTFDTSKIHTNFNPGDQKDFIKNDNANKTNLSNENYTKVSKYLDVAHKSATIFNNLISDLTSAIIAETKFEYTQARRIMASAVSYVNLRKESYSVDDINDLYTAIGEMAEFEVSTEFEEENI